MLRGKMKNLIQLVLLSLFLIAPGSAYSFNATYSCAYTTQEEDNDDEVLNTIDIFLNQSNNYFVYTSEELTQPVYAQITSVLQKRNLLTLEGIMPSPWSLGSKFKIEIMTNRLKQKIFFITPNNPNLPAIQMRCAGPVFH